MLNVVKKDGRIDKFNIEKIKTSVGNSAADSNIQLTKKDLDIIARETKRTIVEVRGEDGQTSSYEIRGVIVRVLKELGFRQIAEDFYKGEKIRMREDIIKKREEDQEIEDEK